MEKKNKEAEFWKELYERLLREWCNVFNLYKEVAEGKYFGKSITELEKELPPESKWCECGNKTYAFCQLRLEKNGDVIHKKCGKPIKEEPNPQSNKPELPEKISGIDSLETRTQLRFHRETINRLTKVCQWLTERAR